MPQQQGVAMNSQHDSTVFSRDLWQTVVVIVVFAMLFILYVYAEKQIDRANEMRLNSFLLADELRQSSDDLTRMVRTYVATGNIMYKHHYQEILDIRNGKRPRPIDYENIYWDLVGWDDRRPRGVDSDAKSLIDRIRLAGFTKEEMNKLAEAKKNSDLLTDREFQAMRLIESEGSDEQKTQRQRKAISLLHDEVYHDAKKSIMRPIGEFYLMMNNRTASAVQSAINTALIVQIAFICTGFILLFMLWRLNNALKLILGSSVGDLHERITRIGKGDFNQTLHVDNDAKESILGWLEETQTQLKSLNENNRRLKQLYVALSQCNQSIVRSKNERELFQNVCQSSAQIDFVQMVWIGKVSDDGTYITPVAYNGEGTEYLDGVCVSIDPDDTIGRGPTAYAYHNRHSYWCQDFINDPATLPWHERAKEFGWKASAALPLFCEKEVVGVLSLYSSHINAFDAAARSLLGEMATDISYALDSYAHAEARQKAEKTLMEREAFYHGVFASVNEAVIILNNNIVLDCNERAFELFDVEKNGLIGKNILEYDIHCPESSFHHALHSAAEKPLSSIKCSIILSPDLPAKIVEINLSTFVDGKLILVARDITQKLEEEKINKMQARQAQLGEMIAMIAHQWRQPLSVINSIVSQISLHEMMKEDEDTVLVENLVKIEQQCKYLSQTISDYRELSDPNKPKEHVVLSQLLHHALNLFDHTLKSSGIEFKEVIVDDCNVETYHNQVVQVLLAFFKNSLDAFVENSVVRRTITVTIESDDEYGIISVKDNAGGISEAIIHKIFAPYFTTKNKKHGTGLGLYMSKMIIEKHCNGVLEVSSDDQESVFRIKLPR